MLQIFKLLLKHHKRNSSYYLIFKTGKSWIMRIHPWTNIAYSVPKPPPRLTAKFADFAEPTLNLLSTPPPHRSFESNGSTELPTPPSELTPPLSDRSLELTPPLSTKYLELTTPPRNRSLRISPPASDPAPPKRTQPSRAPQPPHITLNGISVY